MKSTLRDIPGYEGLYQASTSGDIYAINYRKSGKSRKLKSFINSKGYLSLCLTKNGIGNTARVHRLVGLAHLPNPDNHPCLNHKNGNKLDNRAFNLEWCTVADNNLHAYRKLKRNHRKKGVDQYDLSGKFIKSFKSMASAQRSTGVDETSIGRVANGISCHAGGFKWKFNRQIYRSEVTP